MYLEIVAPFIGYRQPVPETSGFFDAIQRGVTSTDGLGPGRYILADQEALDAMYNEGADEYIVGKFDLWRAMAQLHYAPVYFDHAFLWLEIVLCH
jgi:hypothetical protein